MEFLFTEENKQLEILEEEWIDGHQSGAYMLIGKSGSGKTTFLQKLDKDLQSKYQKKMITWVTVENVIDALLKEKDIFALVQTPVIVLENMEEFVGKESTLLCFFGALNAWVEQGKYLFIGTSTTESLDIPEYVTILKNKQINITPQIVEELAVINNLQFDDEQSVLWCKESEGRMTKLIGLLNTAALTCRI